MTKSTTFPVPFTAEQFDHLYTLVERLTASEDKLAALLGLDRVTQQDHPIVGSPVHLRSNDGHGHLSCMPAICVQVGDDENPDVITVVAFNRGGEGLGSQPAARRTDVARGIG